MGDTFARLVYHIVFSTKGREPLIGEGVRERLYEYIGGIIRGEGGSLLQGGGMPDHLHLLARFKPDTAVSVMVRKIKANSSRWMKELPEIGARFSWQMGYGAFSVSESQIPVVRKYIENQARHHAGRSFLDEMVTLLRKCNIEVTDRSRLD
jgi:REP element-mobilizing transposase RayT